MMSRRPNCIARCDSSCRQLAHCIQRSETEVFAKVIWGAQCRKSARWVLLGETSSRSHARSVRALARKRQITARLRKGLPLQGSSLPSSGLDLQQARPSEIVSLALCLSSPYFSEGSGGVLSGERRKCVACSNE